MSEITEKVELEFLKIQFGKAKEHIIKLEDALRFISEQHCPQRPESAVGRTLKMCIEHSKEVLGLGGK